MENLEEMDNFLGKYMLPKVAPLELENLTNFHRKKMETVIKNPPNKDAQNLVIPQVNSTKSSKTR